MILVLLRGRGSGVNPPGGMGCLPSRGDLPAPACRGHGDQGLHWAGIFPFSRPRFQGAAPPTSSTAPRNLLERQTLGPPSLLNLKLRGWAWDLFPAVRLMPACASAGERFPELPSLLVSQGLPPSPPS